MPAAKPGQVSMEDERARRRVERADERLAMVEKALLAAQAQLGPLLREVQEARAMLAPEEESEESEEVAEVGLG
jgi:multidrug resistance efflux pump